MIESYRPYIVRHKIVETPEVTTVVLAPKEGTHPSFIAGQFVNVHIPRLGSEAKSYTISSTPHDKDMAISVRRLGAFSSAIIDIAIGNELLLSEPVGYFYPEDTTAPRVFIAAGIGIAPFLSILKTQAVEKSGPETLLLYSNKTWTETAFHEQLSLLEGVLPFKTEHFITRERLSDSRYVLKRIDISSIRHANDTMPNATYFICGSIAFVRDMRAHLKELGIQEERQYTESYF